jgi:hypothetical protein
LLKHGGRAARKRKRGITKNYQNFCERRRQEKVMGEIFCQIFLT